MLDHSGATKQITEGLRVLRKRIRLAKIPSMALDEGLNIATWNIRAFGGGRSDAAIHYIAEIIWQFGLVAIIELKDNLEDLSRVMQILGPNWAVVFSDFNTDPAGNRERIAFLYDKRVVTPTGLAAEADPPRVKDPKTGTYLPQISFWRSPYMATFRSGNFDFLVLAAHIQWGSKKASRVAELGALADWVEARSNEKFVADRDMIVLGDFNIPTVDDDYFKAITRHHLRIPKALRGTGFGSNLAKDKRYDQILHDSRWTKMDSDKGGVLDFAAGDWRKLFPESEYPDMNGDDFTFELSDHLPLWIHVDTWVADAQLDEIIEPESRRRH